MIIRFLLAGAVLGLHSHILLADADPGAFLFRSPAADNHARIDNRFVYQGFGCNGENLSPPLEWRNAPEETRSFAITVYDPDAPTGSGWWHWQVFNLPAELHSLPEGAGTIGSHRMPAKASQGRNDFGSNAYGGACPPAGDNPHRYQFTLFALDTDFLDIPENASAALVGYMLNTHKITSSSFTLYYSR